MNRFPIEGEALAPYTSSMYQTFQTAQITELLAKYGPIGEVFIDIPEILGPGYRSYLYQHISRLQSEAVIMMNSGLAKGYNYDKESGWPNFLLDVPPNKHGIIPDKYIKALLNLKRNAGIK